MSNLKREIYINKIIFRHISTLSSTMNRSSRQKIDKEKSNISDMLVEMYLTDICRAFHPTTAEYIFFSVVSRICDMLGHKINLNKYKRIEVIGNIFSSISGIKLVASNRKKLESCENCTTHSVNNVSVKEAIKRETKNYLETKVKTKYTKGFKR